MAYNNRNQYDQDWDQNRSRFDQGNDYNQNYDYNQNRNRGEGYRNSGNYGNASYGNRYDRRDDWSQDTYNTGGAQYRNDYERNNDLEGGWNSNRENYDRNWGNTGSNYGGSYSNRNMRRNYGNMNNDRGNRDWWDRTRDEVSSWFGDDDAERRRNTDKRMTGEHKGKGPKGYTRSDDRIREDVHDRLADDPYVDASDIEVRIENGDVILTGNVFDRDQKRRAEDVVESISGVRNVENRIHVHHEHFSNVNQRRGNYTGTTNDTGGIGNESGTTNEVIRNTGNMNANR